MIPNMDPLHKLSVRLEREALLGHCWKTRGEDTDMFMNPVRCAKVTCQPETNSQKTFFAVPTEDDNPVSHQKRNSRFGRS